MQGKWGWTDEESSAPVESLAWDDDDDEDDDDDDDDEVEWEEDLD